MIVTFNGVSSETYGAKCFRVETDSASPVEYDVVNVIGKNGESLIPKNRFPNEHNIYTYVFLGDLAESQFKQFRNALMAVVGYSRLEDSEHPDEYYSAYVSAPIVPVITSDRKYIKCEVDFSRLPQRFLKSGESVLYYNPSSYTLANPTLYPALPSIRFYGNGTLTINGNTIDVISASSYTDIDFETGDHTPTASRITLSTVDYEPLLPGDNSITTDFATIQITPRWWTR